MDVTAFRSEEPLFGIFESSTSQTFDITNLYIRLYDDKGNVITSPPIDLTDQGITWDSSLNAYVININFLTSADPDILQEILDKLDSLPFLRAYINTDGNMVLMLEPDQTTVYGFEIGENYDDTGNSFVNLLNTEKYVYSCI